MLYTQYTVCVVALLLEKELALTNEYLRTCTMSLFTITRLTQDPAVKQQGDQIRSSHSTNNEYTRQPLYAAISHLYRQHCQQKQWTVALVLMEDLLYNLHSYYMSSE